MKSHTIKTYTSSAALILTMLAGVPAFADDTELLVVDPANTIATPPNIMFILDTSGSMGDPANTIQPYDSTFDYTSGSCDTDKLYWTTLPAEPSCAGGGNTQFIDETSFDCDDAILRMSGIGAYTGVMVQHHSGGGGSTRWQHLAIGNSTDPVECQNDSAMHGNGTAGEVYAQAGSDLAPYTSDSNAEISWGSGDAAIFERTGDNAIFARTTWNFSESVNAIFGGVDTVTIVPSVCDPIGWFGGGCTDPVTATVDTRTGFVAQLRRPGRPAARQ